MERSGYELVGLSYVAKDKKEDDLFIDVYPIEQIPTATGDLNASNIINTTVTDMAGNKVSVVVDKDNLITPKWIPQSRGNRLTAPDVCKGEMVFLYTMNGTDKYYWDTAFNRPSLRKREKALFFFSNKGGISEDNILKKGYFLLVDTINKVLSIHTADNDGELTTYDISIDTKAGVLAIEDGKRNKIELRSAEDHLEISTNSKVTINTKVATINATDKAEINTKQFTVNSERTDINPG